MKKASKHSPHIIIRRANDYSKSYNSEEKKPTKKVRILIVFAEPFSFGGQESFIINLYNHIDHDRFHIDFLTPYACERDDIQSILRTRCEKIFYGNYDFYSPLRKKYYTKYMSGFFNETRKYDVVHINSGSSFALSYGAKVVRRAVPNAKILLHSHATGYGGFRHTMTTFFLKSGFNKADLLIGCSKDALIHRFTKESLKRNKTAVIGSGIDINEYKFNKKIRDETRRQIDAPDSCFVLGHVGRFTAEKNHMFIIDTFKTITSNKPDSKLVLVGDGPNKNTIKRYVDSSDLSDRVIFIDAERDIRKYLCAMDSFIFPSLFEGFGMSAVEAQASGLPTFCSDAIPKEVAISSDCHFVSLSLDCNEWANIILKNSRRSKSDRAKIQLNVPDSIDITSITEKFEHIYSE